MTHWEVIFKNTIVILKFCPKSTKISMTSLKNVQIKTKFNFRHAILNPNVLGTKMI